MNSLSQDEEGLEARRRRWALERVVRTTGDLVRCCSLANGAPALAYAFGREAVHAARTLGWWAEDREVPAAALQLAQREPAPASFGPDPIGGAR